MADQKAENAAELAEQMDSLDTVEAVDAFEKAVAEADIHEQQRAMFGLHIKTVRGDLEKEAKPKKTKKKAAKKKASKKKKTAKKSAKKKASKKAASVKRVDDASDIQSEQSVDDVTGIADPALVKSISKGADSPKVRYTNQSQTRTVKFYNTTLPPGKSATYLAITAKRLEQRDDFKILMKRKILTREELPDGGANG